MSKRKRQYSYKFGRVFFPGEATSIPSVILFQPLGNHVGNVRKLVKLWDKESFTYPPDLSLARVLESASIHDNGKPQKFEIQVKTSKDGKFKEYIYSFKGHRYLAKSHKDAWAEALAIGHHDFSVGDICTQTYELKKEQKYADILTREPLAYASELYTLEMCDQIEAELACRVFEDGNQADSRTFMEFTITPDESDNTVYFIDPWIFGDQNSIELSFRAWVMHLSEDDKVKLNKCTTNSQEQALGKTLDNIVKKWWESEQGQPKVSINKTVILCSYPSVREFKTWTAEDFYKQLGGFLPNPMQLEMFATIYDSNGNKHPALLLKSPTGSGKFESIVFPALASSYRLILPLPARSLLEDQKERAEKYLKKFSLIYKDREVSLVIDTGSQMYRYIFKNGEQVKQRTSNPRRHLYKGDIILTTLDKFLYRYFAFGDKQKSFIFPLRIHQDKTLICFDDPHSYDEISFTNFHSLVKSLYEAGRSIVLMTATMPYEYLKRLDYLESIDYINDIKRAEELKKFQEQTIKQNYPNKKYFQWISDIYRNSEAPEIFQNEFAQVVIRELQAKPNCKLIVVVERVTDAAAIYEQLNQDILEPFLFLYHGRIADQVRPDIYKQIQERNSKDKPYILITTSAIEVGCDLNAEVLISEICPPANLIQRAGRCNRKGNIPNAKVILLGNSIPDFANSLDDLGWQKYQQVLNSLQEFDTEKITECISTVEQVDDYRVIELFSMLHDYVYEADLTCKHTHEKGLVITRSWTPSATLVYKNGFEQVHTITVPVDRLIKNKNGGNDFANTYALEYLYNQETTRRELRPLSWGYAYSKDIVIEIHKNCEGAEIYDGKDEYEYNHKLGFIKLPGVFIKPRTNSNDLEEKLLYKDNKNKSVIIKYTKAFKTE
ncbi:MAG: CRISPR-associated helicase Cas3' [Nostoc sp. TH1S01]|nr:CRISPR-associated helicase Cas3' [Nostoc sp. TH1S01]